MTDTVEVPEVAFTGDTTSDWITNASGDPVAADALRAKLLICECTFVDDSVTPEARVIPRVQSQPPGYGSTTITPPAGGYGGTRRRRRLESNAGFQARPRTTDV